MRAGSRRARCAARRAFVAAAVHLTRTRSLTAARSARGDQRAAHQLGDQRAPVVGRLGRVARRRGELTPAARAARRRSPPRSATVRRRRRAPVSRRRRGSRSRPQRAAAGHPSSVTVTAAPASAKSPCVRALLRRTRPGARRQRGGTSIATSSSSARQRGREEVGEEGIGGDAALRALRPQVKARVERDQCRGQFRLRIGVRCRTADGPAVADRGMPDEPRRVAQQRPAGSNGGIAFEDRRSARARRCAGGPPSRRCRPIRPRG